MKHANIAAIEFHLPEEGLTTADLAADFPDWAVEKIDSMTGIEERRVSKPGECASDLAIAAARKLFESGACHAEDIDFVLLCTQSPDYVLPTTACLLQNALGIPTHAGALDVNLGSSGYVYGLGLAEGLIASGQASRVLLLTADTYTKYVHPRDKSVRTIFGDAAAATLLRAAESEAAAIGPFVYGTDGSGAKSLFVPTGGCRKPRSHETAADKTDGHGNVRSEDNLFMDGAEIFNFALAVVPKLLNAVLEKSGLNSGQIDWFVFHQANRYILEHLRKRMKIAPERFLIRMAKSGNTASCTIPIALKTAVAEGLVRSGMTLLLAGFGPGYSWGGTVVRWSA